VLNPLAHDYPGVVVVYERGRLATSQDRLFFGPKAGDYSRHLEVPPPRWDEHHWTARKTRVVVSVQQINIPVEKRQRGSLDKR